MTPEQALNTLCSIAHERVIDQRGSGHTATADGLKHQMQLAIPVLLRLVKAASHPTPLPEAPPSPAPAG